MMRRSVLFLCMFVGLILVNGCAPVREVASPPPVSPSSSGESGGIKEETPRRMASLHLTEKGKGELEQGELKKAMDRFEKAIGLDAKNSAAYYFFAEARFRQKEYQQSLTLLSQAERLMTNDSDWLIKVYLLQGKNYEAIGNKKEAVRKYQKVLVINPFHQEALERLK